MGDDNLRRYLTLSALLHFVIFIIFVFDIFNFFVPRTLPLPTDVQIISEADFQKFRAKLKNRPKQAPENLPDAGTKPEKSKSSFSDALEAVNNLQIKEDKKPSKEKPKIPENKNFLQELNNLIVRNKNETVLDNKTLESLKEKSNLARDDAENDDEDKLEEITETEANQQTKQTNIEHVLSFEEITILKEQIAECWNPPLGAKNLESLTVKLYLTLDKNANIKDVKLIAGPQKQKFDPFFRTAVENAMRAIRHPACTPLKLPLNKYNTWKQTILVFDPSQIL